TVFARVDVGVWDRLGGRRSAAVDRRALVEPLGDELEFGRNQENFRSSADNTLLAIGAGAFEFTEGGDSLLEAIPIDAEDRVRAGDVVAPTGREEGRVIQKPRPEHVVELLGRARPDTGSEIIKRGEVIVDDVHPVE